MTAAAAGCTQPRTQAGMSATVGPPVGVPASGAVVLSPWATTTVTKMARAAKNLVAIMVVEVAYRLFFFSVGRRGENESTEEKKKKKKRRLTVPFIVYLKLNFARDSPQLIRAF